MQYLRSLTIVNCIILKTVYCDDPNGDHLVHVPMSLRARTSALDVWLILKRYWKVIRRFWLGDLEWQATSVCGVLWILARQFVCNTFHLSICVRSFELLSGVHFSVLSSPRVILIGTVARAAPSELWNSVVTQQKLRVTQTWQLQPGLQSIAIDSPHIYTL